VSYDSLADSYELSFSMASKFLEEKDLCRDQQLSHFQAGGGEVVVDLDIDPFLLEVVKIIRKQ